MVMKMNKNGFISELQEKIGYSKEKCIVIVNILENHFIIGKNNKKKIINDLVSNSFSEDEAENIYDISMKIIILELKNKFKHPFRNMH